MTKFLCSTNEYYRMTSKVELENRYQVRYFDFKSVNDPPRLFQNPSYNILVWSWLSVHWLFINAWIESARLDMYFLKVQIIMFTIDESKTSKTKNNCSISISVAMLLSTRTVWFSLKYKNSIGRKFKNLFSFLTHEK